VDGDAINGRPEREPVASFRHSLVFVAIVAIVVAAGYAAQHRQVAGGGLAESHAHVIPIYVSAAALDWLLLWFAWSGIRRRGGTFGSVIRGRWASGLDVARDVGIAALAWGVMSLAGLGMERLLGHGQEKSLDIPLPRTLLEVLVWIATSASAGFCEEFVFRGYVQRQLLALSGSGPVAVLGQAVVFAAMHAYQGWRPVVQIAVLGLLFGVLAAWRKTLRVGMVAHAWTDVWSGWLARVIVR
jgi:uncharacterized protein